MNWKSKDYLYYKIMQFSHENKIGVNTNLEKLCKEKSWFLIPYPENKMETLKSISKDGFTVKDGNNFFINYNPQLKSECYGRYRFTIAHEIGHIYLYHHIYVDNYILMHSSDKKGIWEQQADIFAQNLLLPIKYKNFYKSNNQKVIKNTFCVSAEMINTRMGKMYQDELFTRKLITKIRNGTLN
ncbi:ImmA/IrrE family metallo-endopeptidase [Peptoniphilus lacydonensis]|uniref:ImmA/IrrE family metallo-endopeptidase n=1 Tax=Peptoniphilus lacydonensis TaxID=1673725 RepID=UPI002913507D|nr:ImmA/IrrE family metallo-endopeptidase [Peptoniphilus lacydonensis]MDU5436175.1 ImmA/IrrE family metallo-endopeptidase [Peptoniphilus lacydonensis]